MTVTLSIAKTPGDYQMAHVLMRKEGVLKTKLGFPTVLAMHEGQLIGMLGTHIQKKMIVAGPLTLKSDQWRWRTAIRLIEAYETVMTNLKIKSFIFYSETDGVLTRGIERYYPYITPYAMRDGYNFYIWRIEDGWRRKSTRTFSGREGSSEEPSGTAGPPAPNDRTDERAEQVPPAILS